MRYDPPRGRTGQRHSLISTIALFAGVCPGCVQAWLRFSNLRSSGAGTLSASSRDVESCLAECVGDAACVFVDHAVSTDPQQCWIHTDAAELDQVETAAGYNQFVLVRRCTVADRKYTCAGARFTECLTKILRSSYDNAKVTIDLRRTFYRQNILRRTQGFS